MDVTVISQTKEQLRRSQRALVDYISSRWEIDTNDPSVNQVTKEYNEITKDLFALEDGGNDPLSVFPVEIWSEIIQWILPADFVNKMKTIQQLMAVSTLWRSLIINEPSFWTQIEACYFVDDYKNIILSLAKTCLERSQAAELHISGTFEDPAWEANLAAIVTPHSHRIKHISASYMYNVDSTRASRLPSLFPTTPALKTILFLLGEMSMDSLYMSSIINFIQRNPQLMDIGIVCHEMLQPELLPNLTHITLRCEASQAISTLRKLPKLRSVSFCHMELQTRVAHIEKKTLPWTELTYIQHNYAVGISLLGLLRTTLRNLYLNVDALHLRHLMEALGYLIVLDAASLSLDLGDLSPLLLRSLLEETIKERSNLRELRVYSSSDLETEDFLFGDDAKRFWDWLLLRTPNTEKLSLPFVLRSTMVTLTNLPKLRQFCCESVILYKISEFECCSMLQDLNLECGAEALLMLSSETTRTLGITLREAHPIEFRASRWPNLSVLSLRLFFDFTSEPITLDLPSLSEINVDGTLQVATAVIHSLACDQNKVPCLESLSFTGSNPELDILFILLERRLLSPDLKPLGRLTISKAISSHVLSLLVDRIRGLFTARPTLFELSVDARARNILDNR
ncbi:SubName: Full=Uncharacterized protein {ECO:0000313/EMBL:CCA70911.1} [Serendipita indica DSM 11827]|uniref:F-box domain-containing protein n=1 Tax=Serendipita indica (strain DSM 11827) TaxID=1109443 RepID=G4THW3_SERID|nr:SubName: Full=Uncharacterized protein {ECO:0000313/EMBL:CCA70911.1} [Serendipita indica DSM 11827]CCA70911.1 hypothetical protein PIIN_04847 [Serendipita indica DSM 11827]